MENYYTDEQQAFLEELMCGGGAAELDNYYTNQAYLAAVEGCLSLESIYNNDPNNYNISNSVPTSFENISPQLSHSHSHSHSPPDFTMDSSSSINFEAQTLPYAGAHGFWNGPAQGMDYWAPCKMEPVSELPGAYNLGFGQQVSERKSKPKKATGQPSKNLMAERRRRNRLNDRLSMLRSVVPKISKMDRTSILGDTIDYVKELIEKINGLQNEMHFGSDELRSLSIFNDVKPNEIVVRNSPKFDVERRDADTRIEICCGAKPGLLLSTVTTLEALGLDTQQCVISCFNEFSVQASCSEEMKQRAIFDSEDVRQALLRNAGYGEGCV